MKKLVATMLAAGLLTHGAFAAITPGLLVGYVDETNTSQSVSLVTAVQQHYNMIIIGFGSVNGADVGLGFTPSSDFATQITTAQQQGAKILVTLGGENNTFSPGNVAAKTVADNIYANLVQKYHLDGIDFDLESVSCNASYVEAVINELKSQDPNIIITGAPQASIWWKNGSGTLSFAPSIWAGKDGLVQSGLFNDILLQIYNQGGGIQIYTPSGNALTGTDPGIIAAVYDTYMQHYPMPGTTKLILGEPSSAQAGTGLDSPKAIVADYACLETGKNCQGGYTPSQLYPNMPGLMTWSIGWDAQNSPAWSFSSGVYQCVVNHQCA